MAPVAYELIAANHACDYLNTDLVDGYASPAACAAACKKAYGCRFFHFTTYNHCHSCMTTDETCPEAGGLRSTSQHSFYQLMTKTVKVEAWPGSGRIWNTWSFWGGFGWLWFIPPFGTCSCAPRSFHLARCASLAPATK